jgi:IS1 family transposase
VNREYLETHKNITIRLEMDEMWSFYHDKTHQIRLWWAIDHESGEAIAFWFGRKHLSLRTWSARLMRKGIRFSKTAQMHKIVVALTINIWFFGRVCLF